MTAEQQYREAFERLKANKPTTLPKGTPVSQNNVAKEAGTDPSALRKSRFPSLIAEIQRYLATSPPAAAPSKRQALLSQRNRNRTLKEQLADAAKQRDMLASLLLEADATILELRDQVQALQKKAMQTNVIPLGGKNS
jgi:small-conductance mechanosensitive channel